jgi:hypothetical protein
LLDVLTILFLHAALPFIVLSTTAVVAQSWLSRSSLGRHYDPYPLYAASNAGSLIALLGYTFLAEPLMGLRIQSLTWTGGYIAYMLLVAAAWFLLRPEKESTVLFPEDQVKSGWNTLRVSACMRWILLSSLPSALLLAVTNFIALEVGSFPLTWVFPLALYLGSFIVTFRSNGGVPGFLRVLWPELMLGSFFLYLLGPSHWLAIIGHLTAFFLICLVAHGSLYELRPPASHLTHFYLLIALGGWIGGAIVSLVAPFAFRGLFEYPVILVFICVTFWWCHGKSISFFSPGKSFLAASLRMAIIVAMLILIGMESWASLNEPIIYTVISTGRTGLKMTNYQTANQAFSGNSCTAGPCTGLNFLIRSCVLRRSRTTIRVAVFPTLMRQRRCREESPCWDSVQAPPRLMQSLMI